MKDKKKSYAITVLTSLTIILLSIATLNLLVDPYNKFGFNRLGVFISAERESKATSLTKNKDNYSVILLGNSKAAMIDPASIDRSFNAAFGGATIREVYDFTEKYIPEGSTVIIGFDLGQLAPQETSTQNSFSKPWTHILGDYLLSLKTTEYSFKTLHHAWSKKHSPGILPNGAYNSKRWFEHYDQPNPSLAEEKISEITQSFLSAPECTTQDLFYYQKLKDLLLKKNITYITYFYPLHQEVLNRINANPKTIKRLNKFRDQLALTFPDTLDFHNSPYSHPKYFFQSDPLHFKPAAGNQLIEQIANFSLQK